MIECRQVTKLYRGKAAVDAVDFTLTSGICGLLGANGAGKSTLLKLMTGLIAPDSGSVRVAGHDMTGACVSARQNIGVVPEEMGLFESLSISENLLLIGPIYGLSLQETKDRSEELLEFLDLRSEGRKRVSECSYGMRKKTALAMALVHNPKALFLDEPFEGIDPSSSRNIQQMLTSTAEKGTTILLTSHILPLMETLANRVVILKRGRLVWDSDEAGRFNAETYHKLADESEDKEFAWLGS